MASLRTQDVDAIGMHPAPPRPQGVRLPQGSALEKRGMIYSPKSEEDDTSCLYEAEHDGKYDGPEDGTTSPPDDAVWEKPKDSAVIPKWVGNYDDDITVSTA